MSSSEPRRLSIALAASDEPNPNVMPPKYQKEVERNKKISDLKRQLRKNSLTLKKEALGLASKSPQTSEKNTPRTSTNEKNIAGAKEEHIEIQVEEPKTTMNAVTSLFFEPKVKKLSESKSKKLSEPRVKRLTSEPKVKKMSTTATPGATSNPNIPEQKTEIKETKAEAPKIPEAFDELTPVDHGFVVPASSDFNKIFSIMELKHKFEILDSSGQTIYFAAELLENKPEHGTGHCNLDLIILGHSGEFICDVTGSTRFATIQDDKMVTHGTIEQSMTNNGFTVKTLRPANCLTYQLIPAGEGSRMLELNSKEATTINIPHDSGEYHIFSPTSGIGEIKCWSNANNEHADRLEGCYGLNFPHDIDSESKIVFLSSLLVLYFLHKISSPTDSRSLQRKEFWVAFLYSFVVGLLVLGMFITVLYFSFRPK